MRRSLRLQTPYFYSTFSQGSETVLDNESVSTNKKKIVVLGSGPNRIGQGIEFDYSCVHGILAAKEAGYEAIMINSNPETVSTDFDIADKLYFEPVFWEHVYDIIQHEKPEGVIVQLGGQTALKLAEKLSKYGIKIIGTSFEALDLAEDRGAFSALITRKRYSISHNLGFAKMRIMPQNWVVNWVIHCWCVRRMFWVDNQ